MAIDIRRLTRLAIGINTENGVEEYRFDMWPWLEEHPQLNEFQINVTPPGGMPYKAQTHMDGFYLVWPITSRDTALPGDDGWYEVEAFGEGGLHKLSPKKPLVVYERMAGDLGEAPETIKTWVEEAYEVLDSSKTATEAANAAASAANNAAANIKTATNTTLGVVKGGPGILIGEDGRLEGKRPVNLLDNGDFRDPVNQRGQSSYTGKDYTIDRWYTYSTGAQININSGYITLASSALMQRLIIDPDKTYTAAVKKLDGSVIVLSGIPRTGFGSANIGAAVTMDGDYVRFLIGESAGSVVWAALYEGSYNAENLPEYQPKGYSAELAESQRYYRPFVDTSLAFATSATGVQVEMPLNPPMRVAPTITVTGAVTAYKGDAQVEVLPSYVAASSPTRAAYMFYAGSGFSAGDCAILTNIHGEISADL